METFAKSCGYECQMEAPGEPKMLPDENVYIRLPDSTNFKDES